VQLIDKHTFRIVLREGRNHQIRRMCEYLKLTVISLKRIRIGPITLTGLRPGEFRVLSAAEVTRLKQSK
jgi:pseudouridine synthase